MNRTIATFCVFIFLLGLVNCETTSAQSPDFRIAGYLPDYRLADFDLTATTGLTDLLLFSAQPAANGELDLSRLQKAPWQKLREFKTRNRVRLILTVGGWDRCKHFAKVASSKELRQKFVESAIKHCLELRLDGIDLDWEHPKTEPEQQAYADLLGELRTAFAPHGLTLTMTMAAWQRVPKKAFEAVDWVQVMAYDHDGRHSTPQNSKADVEALIAAGAPFEKITLGLPFYGRGIVNRNVTKTYRELVAAGNLTPGVDEVGDIYFNGPLTINGKVEFAKEEHLAGVMIWELGQDAAGAQSLLKVVTDAAVSSRKQAK